MARYGERFGYPPPWWGDRGDPRYLGFERAQRYRRGPIHPPPLSPAEEEARFRNSRYGRHLADVELREAVRRSLYSDPALAAGRIQVAVQDAVVTLRGTVDDYLQARYAWDDAWETDGVRGVICELEVEEEVGDIEEEAAEEETDGATSAAPE